MAGRCVAVLHGRCVFHPVGDGGVVMSERMSDERLAEIGECGVFDVNANGKPVSYELLQALKEEREYVKDLTSGIVVDGWIETETRLRKRINELESAIESRLSEISRLQATLDHIRSCQRYEISELDCDLVATKKGIWMLADDVLGVLDDE